jgi:hypothetical protein
MKLLRPLINFHFHCLDRKLGKRYQNDDFSNGIIFTISYKKNLFIPDNMKVSSPRGQAGKCTSVIGLQRRNLFLWNPKQNRIMPFNRIRHHSCPNLIQKSDFQIMRKEKIQQQFL